MPGQKCFVCGSTLALDPKATFHCIPKSPENRASWLRALGVQESDVKPLMFAVDIFLVEIL